MFLCAFILCLCCLVQKDHDTEEEARAQQKGRRTTDEWILHTWKMLSRVYRHKNGYDLHWNSIPACLKFEMGAPFGVITVTWIQNESSFHCALAVILVSVYSVHGVTFAREWNFTPVYVQWSGVTSGTIRFWRHLFRIWINLHIYSEKKL
jgi:hypothetical protein